MTTFFIFQLGSVHRYLYYIDQWFSTWGKEEDAKFLIYVMEVQFVILGFTKGFVKVVNIALGTRW